MTRLHTSYTYATDVESVFALVSDPAFRDRSCAAQGAVEHDVEVETDVDGATIVIRRLQDAAMPDFVKRFVGELARVEQTEIWTSPDRDGNRSALITVDIIGQPAGMKGGATLRSVPGGCEFTVEGDVKVAVPFLGRRLEPAIVQAIVDSVDQDVELGKPLLA